MFPSPSPGPVVCIRSTTTIAVVFVQAGHMYKTFAKDSGEAYRREQDSPAAAAATTTVAATSSPKFVGMHAARCFLGALGGYSGSGWLAAEEYACTVLPTEVRFWPEEISAWCCFVADVEEGVWGVVTSGSGKTKRAFGGLWVRDVFPCEGRASEAKCCLFRAISRWRGVLPRIGRGLFCFSSLVVHFAAGHTDGRMHGDGRIH